MDPADLIKLAEHWPIGLTLGFSLVFGVPFVGWKLAGVIGKDDEAGLLEPRNLVRFVVLCFSAFSFSVGVVILSIFAIAFTIRDLRSGTGPVDEPLAQYHAKIYEQQGRYGDPSGHTYDEKDEAGGYERYVVAVSTPGCEGDGDDAQGNGADRAVVDELLGNRDTDWVAGIVFWSAVGGRNFRSR